MKFNKAQKKENKTTTYENGLGYVKNPLEDWMNFLFSSYLEDRFYEDADVQTERLQELTYKIGEVYGWEFVAKAAFFARNKLGMRSVSELIAGILNAESFKNKRSFYRNYFHRLDGVGEVFSIIDFLGDKRSHALIRGTGDYISKQSEYTLGKYKMKGKTYNLYDIINITHANSPAINKYKKECLEIVDTWETRISNSKNKNDDWIALVKEQKLGYLALIRNLSNILNSNISKKDIETYLVPQIINKKAIKKSLVFPYQIYSAAVNSGITNHTVLAALEKAFINASMNVPELKGESVVLLDVSGSMSNSISKRSKVSIKEVGACYAVALGLKNKVDFIKFGTIAKKVSYNYYKDSIFNIIKEMSDNEHLGYGTCIEQAFNLLDKKYERIFIVSDMQVMDSILGRYAKADKYEDYCNTFGQTKCYSFDLGGYETQFSNPNNPDVFLLTSLNDKVFKFIPYLENKKSLYNFINSINYETP